MPCLRGGGSLDTPVLTACAQCSLRGGSHSTSLYLLPVPSLAKRWLAAACVTTEPALRIAGSIPSTLQDH